MENPYQAPQSAVRDIPTTQNGALIAEGRKVPAGNAISWLTGGWNLFKDNPGIWIVNTLIFGVLVIVLAFIPILGALAMPMLATMLLGGIMAGAAAQDQGEPLTVNHLFSAFQTHASQLVIVGLIGLAAGVVMSVISGILTMVVVGGSFFAAGGMSAMTPGSNAGAMALLAGMGFGMVIVMLVMVALSFVVYSLVFFAPALVVLHDLPPMEAIKASFSGYWKNWLGILLFGLLGGVLAFIGAIPLGLGLLVVYPLLMASVYAAYKDIYLA